MEDVNKILMESASEVRALLGELPGLSRKYAEAEKNYQIAKTRQVLKMRDEGYSAGLISEIVRGMPDVSFLRFYRDLAEEAYKNAQKALSVLSATMSVYQSILRYSAEVE